MGIMLFMCRYQVNKGLGFRESRGGSDGKESTRKKMQETWVQSLGWEDSPGGGHGNPL